MTSMIERLGEIGQPEGLHAADRSIGRILLDAGKLKAGDAERALRVSKEKGIRFGEACIALKLLSQSDIDHALSSQFDFPYLRPGDANLSDELVAAYDPFSEQVEALRGLRTQLLLRWFSPERKVIAVVSPSRGDGRTYIAANLAVVMSQLGERTLLIDADMRSPRQHQLFNLPNQYGLSALLNGRGHGMAIERIGQFSELFVIPAGAVPPNPLELVSRAEFNELLVAESQNFDVIIVDTPAASVSADAQAIGARARGTLLVAREDRSRLDELGRLVASMQNSQTEVVGSVLNR